MKTTVENFNSFFCELGNLCFKIKMVERGYEPFDFTKKESQIINPDYFDEVKKKFPKVIRGFHMAINQKWCDSINCYLQENGEVTVEFCNKDMEIEKTISYPSVGDISKNKISLIHYLTREWKPF